jgi:hypothetical protein
VRVSRTFTGDEGNMRGFYKNESFPNIHGGPRYQVENTTRLRIRTRVGAEYRPDGLYNWEPQRIKGQEEARVNWESFRVIDWRG